MAADEKSEALPVVEVRRHLHEIRKRWRMNDPKEPFHTSVVLHNSELTVAAFAFHFVQSHHRQRTPRG